MFENDNLDALDQDDESVAQSDDVETGDDAPEESEDGQVTEPEAPESEEGEDVQPEPELQLVELPDGRKVTPDAAVEEYKKLQADYTKKSQRVAELEKASANEQKPWQDPDYKPESWGEVMENATKEAERRLEAKQAEKERQAAIADTQLQSEIAGLKKIDPNLDPDAVLDFANKRTEKIGVKYPNFTAAYQDYKMLQKREKLAEKRVVANKKKREADPVASDKGVSNTSDLSDVEGEDLFEKAQNAWKRIKS